MKKLLLIILIVCILGIVFTGIVSAKATFGSWKKWDEVLAPWDNEDWVYSEESLKIISIPPVGGTRFWFWTTEEQEQWRSIKVGGSSSLIGNEEVFFVLTRLAFKNDDQRASIVIFSPAPINKEVKGIEDALATAEIAIAVFPLEKGEKVVIRSYEKRDGLLQFFKKWTVAFKNKTVIFPEKYKDWFINQSKKLTKENISLPQLVVLNESDKKKNFFIGVTLPLFKEFLIKEKLPWIKRETTVVF